MKECKICGETKSLDCFSKHNKTQDGVSTQCKACRNLAYKEHYANAKKNDPRYAKSRKLRFNYKLSLEKYDSLLENQENKCAICKEDLTNPYVDHCHKTGKVRGILCHSCNSGIGFLKDNISILENAIKYLK